MTNPTSTSIPSPNGSLNGHARTQHGSPAPRPSGIHTADVYALRDTSSVPCGTEVELVIFRFASFGRLAHFRRSLLSLPQVRGARIASYGDQTAFFSLSMTPGSTAGSLVLPGTRLITSDGSRVELCVEA